MRPIVRRAAATVATAAVAWAAPHLPCTPGPSTAQERPAPTVKRALPRLPPAVAAAAAVAACTTETRNR